MVAHRFERLANMQVQLELARPTRWSPGAVDITFGYTLQPDNTAPAISARAPRQNATDVSLGFLTWSLFDREMNPSTITLAISALRALGQSGPSSGVTYADRTATTYPDSSLVMGTVYQVTVSGIVEDVSGNALGSE